MYITIEDQLSFMQYPDLTTKQKLNVVRLLWDYYIQISLEEDLPPELLIKMDLHQLLEEEAYEICQLYKDTLQFVEHLFNQ